MIENRDLRFVLENSIAKIVDLLICPFQAEGFVVAAASCIGEPQ